MDEASSANLIRAAGGIVWEGEPWQSRVAIIYRARHKDWSLPKGKLDQGETFEQAALREIEEETGYQVELRGVANEVRYQVKDRPKIVKYWHATVQGESHFTPSEEVERVEWVTVKEALKRLDYKNERQLLEWNEER